MRPHLQRVLGLGFGLAVIVGSTIGIGILRTPGLVAGALPRPSAILAIWAIGGLYTLLGAICLAELGTAIPQAGGYLVYARRAFGDLAGFAVGWTDWLTYCAVLGYVSIALGEFLGILVPSVAGWTRPIAIVALVGLVALQWAGVRISARFQEWATAVKFAAFLGLVIAAMFLAPAHADLFGPVFESRAVTLPSLVAAFQAVVITYGGWQAALYFTEEDANPSRNLPRAMIGGVLAVIVVYLLVNVALMAALPMRALASSTLPAAEAARVIVGDRGLQVITVLSIVSLVPLLNAILMVGTRILFAMGRDGLLWSRAGAVNAGGTPGVATLVTTVVAVALIATGTFQRLVAMTSFFLALNYCTSCLALIVLRRDEPALPRPFRAWGYPWSAIVVAAGAAAFLFAAVAGDRVNSAMALGLLAAGLIGYKVRATSS